MKKNKLLLCVLLGVSSMLFAQQEAQYTQYMYNTMMVNPGYAGSRNVGSFFGLHRSQWIGFPGAPKTSQLSYHAPMKYRNLGLGATLFHETIGPVSHSYFMGDISYTLDFENSKLAFGLKATLGVFTIDNSKLNIKDQHDWIFLDASNVFSPNIGPGAYWYSDKYYLGISVPNLLQTDIYRKEETSDRQTTISVVKNTQHLHIMGGYVFDLSDNIKFKPAVLSKMTLGSPMQLDVSANFMFNERFVIGGAWRWSAAVSGMAGFQINKRWFIGYAYDYETTDISRYTSGSHEIFLRYELITEIEKIVSPRFF